MGKSGRGEPAELGLARDAVRGRASSSSQLDVKLLFLEDSAEMNPLLAYELRFVGVCDDDDDDKVTELSAASERRVECE